MWFNRFYMCSYFYSVLFFLLDNSIQRTPVCSGPYNARRVTYTSGFSLYMVGISFQFYPILGTHKLISESRSFYQIFDGHPGRISKIRNKLCNLTSETGNGCRSRVRILEAPSFLTVELCPWCDDNTLGDTGSWDLGQGSF